MTTKAPIIVVGIDISLQSTGVGLLSDGKPIVWQEIRSGKSRGAQRLSHVRGVLTDFFSNYVKEEPNLVTYEGPSYRSKGRHVDIGKLHGVIELLLFDLGVTNTLIVTPSQLKKYTCGKGQLPKEVAKQILIDRIASTLDLNPDELTDNTADALALAKLGYDSLLSDVTLNAAQEAVFVKLGLRDAPPKKSRRKSIRSV